MRVTADDLQQIALNQVDLGLLGMEWDGTVEAFGMLDLAGRSEPGADDGPWAVYAGQMGGEPGRVVELPSRVAAVAFAAGLILGAHPSEANDATHRDNI
jgi:hypothetical protein